MKREEEKVGVGGVPGLMLCSNGSFLKNKTNLSIVLGGVSQSAAEH